jgi:aspartate racemase
LDLKNKNIIGIIKTQYHLLILNFKFFRLLKNKIMINYKRIGIVGGVSPQSSALFYKTIIEKHYQKNKDYYYPEIIMFSVDFGKIKVLQKENDPTNYIREFVKAIDSLEKAGADFAVIASNTPHRVFSQIEKQVTIPMLSIIDITADYASNKGFKKLLLLGTNYTMREDFYKQGLKKKGLETIVPTSEEQEIVNNIIFNELVIGEIREESRQNLVKIVNHYTADAVILGCTELPLIIRKEDISIALIDTTDVFAEQTLNFANKS